MFNSSQDATDAASASQSSATFTMGGGKWQDICVGHSPYTVDPK